MVRILCALVVCGLLCSTTSSALAGIEIVAKAQVRSVEVKVEKDKEGFVTTHYSFTFSDRCTKVSEEACRQFVTALQAGNVGYSMSGPKSEGKTVTLSIAGPILGRSLQGNTIALEQVSLPPAPLVTFTRKDGKDVLAIFEVNLTKDAKPAAATTVLKKALAGLIDSERDPLKAEGIDITATQVDETKQPGAWRFTLKRKPQPKKAPANATPTAVVIN